MNLDSYNLQKHKPILFYSAWEFRNCIERLMFEYLRLLNMNTWSRAFEKIYRAKDFSKKILKTEPDFYKKIEFINIALKAYNIPDSLYLLDLVKLELFYGRLNDYLHAPKRPAKTSNNQIWWGNFYRLLSDVKDYLEAILGQALGSYELNDKGWKLFDAWKLGELSEKQLIGRFREDLAKDT